MAREGAPAEERCELAGLACREVLTRMARALGAAGIEAPQVDARRLVAAALRASSADLMRDPERVLSDDEARVLSSFLRRRLAHEPVSRILGRRGFYGREFTVTPATLDPRPCSETLVDAVLRLAKEEGFATTPIRILDIGTGSGCLLLTLLAELPHATGVGTDISRGALDVARANAVALGLDDRVTFEERRYLEGIEEPFDILISNPPYIPTGDIVGLDPDVRNFDPVLALDGGADGLDAYREIVHGMRAVVPRGWVLFEVGAGQAQAVAALVFAQGGDGRHIDEPRLFADLGGHMRCVAARTRWLP